MLCLALAAAPGRSLGALFDLVRGKRVRAWNLLCLLASRNPDHYARWIAVAEPVIAQTLLGEMPRETATAIPVMCVISGCGEDSEVSHRASARTAASARAAFGPGIRIAMIDAAHAGRAPSPGDELAALLDGLENDCWLVPLRAGDLLSSRCGQALAMAVNRQRGDTDCCIVYWDSDELADTGSDTTSRSAPWIKGEWDPLLYLSRDSLTRSCALRADAAKRVLSQALPRRDAHLSGCELLAALIMVAVGVPGVSPPAHIPLILTHRGPSQQRSVPFWTRLVARHWAEPVELTQDDIVPSFHRVSPPQPLSWPSVSIIIPTRDKVELIAACLGGLERLRYPGDVEILVVDNGTTQPEALRLLEARQRSGAIHVIRDDGCFNFARLNNRAAALVRGEVLCLLNNDVEPLDGDWLAAMVRHAVRPDTGAVGALLLYPDGSVQHAGVSIGTGGAAGHLARHAMPDDPVHFAWHGITRSVSAVTAACLVVRSDAYDDVAGLDEQAFAVAFNDVDFCLKLQQRGLRNVFVAQSRLVHHESVSRGKDHASANIARFSGELARFRQKWGSADCIDPHYSPLFSRSAESCILAF